MRGWAFGILIVVGCAPGPGEPPRDAPRADAPFVCDGELELGHCRSAVSGEPCRGASDEEPTFTAVADGALLAPVVGPQGAQMLVLGARTRGIVPGDPDRPTDPANPVLRVTLVASGGHEVATYNGRGAFVPDSVDPTLLVRPDVFVITEEVLRGRLEAVAVVRDGEGVEHCGRLGLGMP